MTGLDNWLEPKEPKFARCRVCKDDVSPSEDCPTCGTYCPSKEDHAADAASAREERYEDERRGID